MPKAKRYCPYLGLERDRDTCVSYPSPGNYCFRNNKPTRVLLEYQQDTCLAETYPSCPVYAGGGKVDLDRQNREPDLRLQARIKRLALTGLVLLLLFGAGGFGYRYRSELLALLPGKTAQPVVEITYAAPTFIAGSAVSGAYQPMILSTARVESAATRQVITPQPDFTPTPSGPVHGDGLIIHKLRAGENLDILADLYYTSPEAILTVNYKLAPPIPAEKTIVIPEGIVKTAGLPQFEVKYIPDKTKVSFIIEKFDCDKSLFKQYNKPIIITSLDIEYIIGKQWVLIPRPKPKGT